MFFFFFLSNLVATGSARIFFSCIKIILTGLQMHQKTVYIFTSRTKEKQNNTCTMK